MNRENVKYCIELMQNATSFDICDWQSGFKLRDSIDALHSCGNTACFAGYIAISEKFKNDGGIQGTSGAPIIGINKGSNAVAYWLDIPERLAYSFTNGDTCMQKLNDSYFTYSDFYEKAWCDIKPQDVIKKLNQLLNGELV